MGKRMYAWFLGLCLGSGIIGRLLSEDWLLNIIIGGIFSLIFWGVTIVDTWTETRTKLKENNHTGQSIYGWIIGFVLGLSWLGVNFNVNWAIGIIFGVISSVIFWIDIISSLWDKKNVN